MSVERPQLKNTTFVLVEVGGDTVKMGRVTHSRRGGTVDDLVVERYAETDDLTNVIYTCASRLKVGKEPVVALLPRSAINLRLLNLPSTDAAEIADMVDLQVGTQTPYSRDEIMSDHRTVGIDANGYTRIMLGIVQRGVVRQRFSTMEDAELDVLQVSIASEGLLGWYRTWDGKPAAADQSDLVIDVDASHTECLVMSGGELVFSRNLLVGSRELLSGEATWTDRFLQEIERSLEIYRNEKRGLSPTRLVLSGAAGRVPDLAETLSSRFGLPAERVDALADTQLSLDADGPAREVSMTAFLGAARAPEELAFSLLPEPVIMRRELAMKARFLTATGGLVAAVCCAFAALCLTTLSFRGSALAALQEDVADSVGPARQTESLQIRIGELRSRMDAKRSPVNVLREIHLLMPQTVYLKRLDFDRDAGEDAFSGEERIALAGSAQTRNAVREFVRKMDASPLFKSVESPDVNTNRDRVDFRIECRLEL